MAGFVRKFGFNELVTTATDPEDVISEGGLQHWPSAAATCTVASTSTEDDAVGGDGARTVFMEGLDGSYNPVSETITMDGQVGVTSTFAYLRVNRMFVVAIGGGATESNLGTITAKHGGDVLASIQISDGQSLKATYTVPAQAQSPWVSNWSAFSGKKTSAVAEIILCTRNVGEAWRIRLVSSIHTTGGTHFQHHFERGHLLLEPKSDIAAQVREVTADVAIASEFVVQWS